MKIVVSTINFLTNVLKWFGIIVLFSMMIFVFIAVISRSMKTPILGDVEVVQFAMICVIMLSLSYTQMNDKHIKIGLIVDRFSKKKQLFIEVFSLIVTAILTSTIGYIFIKASIKEITGITITSTLLNVPHYPFKIIISFGMFLWALQAILKIIRNITVFVESKNSNVPNESEN